MVASLVGEFGLSVDVLDVLGEEEEDEDNTEALDFFLDNSVIASLARIDIAEGKGDLSTFFQV